MVKISYEETEYINLATLKKTGLSKDLNLIILDTFDFLFSGHYKDVPSLRIIISLNVILQFITGLDPYETLINNIDKKYVIDLLKDIIRCVNDKAYYEANSVRIKKLIEALNE